MTHDDAQILWELYASLMREVEADPKLKTDEKHGRRRAEAYAEFCKAFRSSGGLKNIGGMR